MLATSRATADGNWITQEFGGNERRPPSERGRFVKAIHDAEQSFLVTMTKHGNSEVLAYPPNCPSLIGLHH